ncbi:MAG TPA: RNA-binding protein [Candidatus Angelobacter sp.]|nr:RNA-binding protein [Candidatus Angelobacter sp.]
MKKLYVGNFSFRMTDGELRSLFEPYGVVESANIVTNPETGKSRGFAFVAMPNDEEAANAMAGLNGREAEGRALTVNEARKNNPRSH